MYSKRWQVGLDIQQNSFRSVAVQKRRYGWQLRHWHLCPLVNIVNSCGRIEPEALLEPLSYWRKYLPNNISFRIALPISLILQQKLTLPPRPLSDNELNWYVEASLNKLFPLPASELVFDYRYLKSEQGLLAKSLLVTAMKHLEWDRWLALFAKINLQPEAVDIAPCVLRYMADQLKTDRHSLLIQSWHGRLLLVSPVADCFCFTVLDIDSLSAIQQRDLAYRTYHELSGKWVDSIRYSGEFCADFIELDGVTRCSPFSVIQQISPPLPSDPYAYTIACGLALRSRDR